MNNRTQSNIIQNQFGLMLLSMKIVGYLALSVIILITVFISYKFAGHILGYVTFPLSIFFFFIISKYQPLKGLYRKVLLKNEKNLLIIGDGKSGKSLTQKIITENKLGIKIKGLISEDVIDQKIVDNLICNEKVDEIFISIDDMNYNDLMTTIDLLCNYKIKIKISSELFRIIPKKIQTEKYYDIPVIDITPRIKSDVYFKFKRIVDIVLSTIGLIFLAPILFIIMVLIRLTSKGPIFYKQKRVGLNGKLFDLYKFRSMHIEDGDDKKREVMMINFMKTNKAQKIIDNTRVTRIGKFIRRTSLDELPQLYNVIKGDMSIVGPRPCLPYEFNNYEDWQKRRVKVLPGCTGVWQVSGRSTVSFIDSIVLDLFYINNMSPLYDIHLILKTFPVIFFSKGGE
jgi:exopolysaccharide biosynthesis polyprenyl glycosylphosphotransferase